MPVSNDLKGRMAFLGIRPSCGYRKINVVQGSESRLPGLRRHAESRSSGPVRPRLRAHDHHPSVMPQPHLGCSYPKPQRATSPSHPPTQRTLVYRGGIPCYGVSSYQRLVGLCEAHSSPLLGSPGVVDMRWLEAMIISGLKHVPVLSGIGRVKERGDNEKAARHPPGG